MIACNSMSEAYLEMLQDTLKGGHSFMQVTQVLHPIVDGRIYSDPTFLKRLREFEFNDGRTGGWWLDDRIEALFGNTGEYHEALNREAQYPYVVRSLEGMRTRNAKIGPFWNANRMVVSLVDPKKDLHVARNPMMPCLVLLSFLPIKDQLSLSAVFRAQYTDAKGYGNLHSLAMMLQQVCKTTGYKPKHLYSIAQKAILKYPLKEGRRFHHALLNRVDNE